MFCVCTKYYAKGTVGSSHNQLGEEALFILKRFFAMQSLKT